MEKKIDKKSVYDESKVKTLSSLEHIRIRSGMYIGRLGDGSDPDDGIYVLVKEVLDNSIDEYIMGYGKKVELSVTDSCVKIRDFGRGIPLGKVVECVSIINTGAKYNDDVFQFSVGLNGVGTKAVNALSSYFKVISYRDGEYSEVVFEQGKLKSKKKGKNKDEPNGTYVEFIPDTEIFSEYDFNAEFIKERLWIYACLNTGLSLKFNRETFKTKNGLLDFLGREVQDTGLYPLAYHKSPKLEFTFTHTGNYGESYFSFVNGQFTSDGGTHQSAFREGILKGVNEFYKKNFNSTDVRDGIIGAIAIKVKEPVFESQTKNKLGNTDIRAEIINEVKAAVNDFLHKNKTDADNLLSKIIQNEKLRKELNVVKKEAKEAAKRVSIKIPNLKDCKFHKNDKKRGEETVVFVTEGASASGSIVASRDAMTQAIFSLKGKPLNVFGKNKTAIYKNEELFNLMKALGVEDSYEGLRYNKIILATDADVDGFHIRNLLLTYLLNYFEELVISGHVYVLETPLFRVRNKKKTIYCYSIKERNIALEEISSPEVTRFKGLGEISPNEFGQFIGDDMRITKIRIDNTAEVPEVLEFYMGKNTPTRRNYIMENLL